MPELLGLVGSLEPIIEFWMIEFSPSSGNQDEEFFELINNNSFAVDLSNWSVSGGVEFAIAPGTVIPASSTLIVSPDVMTFRGRNASPTGGESPYRGHLSSFGESLELRAAAGVVNSLASYLGQPSDVQENLVITEIMYHPEPDGAAEYLELMNISNTLTLDLIGVKFTEGITFDFTASSVTSLAPGARVLVAKDVTAFEAAHRSGLPVAGLFGLSSSLSNGGESTKLEDAGSGTVKEFTYNDKAPWPTSPDTAGYSLVLIGPGRNPDPSDPSNWRASFAVGGTPGGTDAMTFQGDPKADLDGDGLSALLEYAMGSSDLDARSGFEATSTGVTEVSGLYYPTFSYRFDTAVDDVKLSRENSADLTGWSEATAKMELMSTDNNGDGTVTTVMRMTTPISEITKLYFRLKVALF